MKKRILSLIFLITPLMMTAQENIFGGNAIKSPVINEDGSVTFRLKASAGSKVQIEGDFLPTVKMETPFGLMDGQAPADMTEEDGAWTFTSEPLSPELYSYYFTVDGVRVLDPSNVRLLRDGNSFTNIFIVRGAESEKGDLYETADVLHGTVSKVWYDSPTLGIKRRLTVYTPAGYDESKDAYPVLYLLHGAGGDEDAWTTLGRAAQILDNLIAQGRVTPMIVIMPNDNPSDQAASDIMAGTDVHGVGSPNLGESVTRMIESFPDITTFVEGRYRVLPGKENRAIAGLSMGGGLSFDISRTYPDQFDYVGLFSPAIFLGGRNPENLQGDNNAETAKVIETLKNQFSQKPKLYWMAIGTSDFLYQADMNFLGMMRDNGFEPEYMETEGGHTWRNWRHYLTVFAEKLFK